MDAPSLAKPNRFATVVVALIWLSAGVVIGVALDRVALLPAAKDTSRPAIVGHWVGKTDGDAIAFNADGTHDWERSFLDATGNQNKWVWKPAPSAQWKWLDGERIEIVGASSTPETYKVVVAGDSLKLLKPEGGVREYRRK